MEPFFSLTSWHPKIMHATLVVTSSPRKNVLPTRELPPLRIGQRAWASDGVPLYFHRSALLYAHGSVCGYLSTPGTVEGEGGTCTSSQRCTFLWCSVLQYRTGDQLVLTQRAFKYTPTVVLLCTPQGRPLHEITRKPTSRRKSISTRTRACASLNRKRANGRVTAPMSQELLLSLQANK